MTIQIVRIIRFINPEHVFYGEVNCTRHMPHLKKNGLLNDDYDAENPDGGEYTRRNYLGSCYVSGVPELEPGEYPWHVGTHYAEYRASDIKPAAGKISGGSPSDPTRPADHHPGS